jgi:transcription elongation factor GreB
MPIATQTISAEYVSTAASERGGDAVGGLIIVRMLPSAIQTDFHAMNKAFVKESEDEDEDDAPESSLPAGTKNYMTVRGHGQLRAEFEHLVKVERPEIVKVVSWAAGNGDRSENGDYIYGKKRLREIDRRIRFLTKRLESAVIVDPADQQNCDQVFFAATVTLCDAAGEEATYQIVGIDEANAHEGRISWISPLARALLKAREGDTVRFDSPGGLRELDVIEVRYE